MRKGLFAGLVALAVGMLPLAASAQTFNIDFGDDFGVPSNAFGGAGAQPGNWNNVNFGGIAFPLTATGGGPTTATVMVTPAGIGTFSFNNAGTTGDNQALLDDLFDVGGLGSTASVAFSGLSAANYTIFTYAWAPDDGGFRTGVAVPGSPQGTAAVGGNWPGALQEGVTHARHTLTVGAGGTATINVSTQSGFGSLNGVQLVPEPATMGLLAVGALVALRRRR